MLGATAFKPVERHGMEAVSWFLYDKNNGAIMGRTPKSWLLITIFYIIYYSCLAGFWALCMFVFMQTIEDDQPRWLHKDSRIGESPALGVRPSQTDALLDSGMFMFNKDKKEDVEYEIPGWEGWVNRTQEFLDSFPKDMAACKKKFPGQDGKFCDNGIALDDKGVPITNIKPEERHKKFYFFDQKALGTECTKAKNFGFSSGKPCVILKLNKIYGLEHTYYNQDQVDADIADDRKVKGHTPEFMPQALKDHITKDGAKYHNHVWVDCHGENAMDNDEIAQGRPKVTYMPASRGFSSIFYPYMNAEGYQTPLLAIQFEDLPVGRLMHIECRAYAGNIKYDRNDRIGKVHFEIMMHDSKTAKEVNAK